MDICQLVGARQRCRSYRIVSERQLEVAERQHTRAGQRRSSRI